MNTRWNIDLELCSKCKFCIEVCPCNIIGINEKEEVTFISERQSICQHCGQCMAVCSTKAITANGFTYDDFIDLPTNKVDYDQFIDFLANRRFVRNFKNKAIPDEILNKILESIAFAPFGAEPEEMSITVINNRNKIESALPYIEEFLNKIVQWVENPIASFMIKRKNNPETFNTIKHHLYPIAKQGNYKLEFGDRITRNAPALIIFHAKKDAAEHSHNSLIYASYIMLAAHSQRLGATMIGLVPPAINKVQKVREIFQIPKENEAVMSVIIGYPKFKYRRTIKRKHHTIEWIE